MHNVCWSTDDAGISAVGRAPTDGSRDQKVAAGALASAMLSLGPFGMAGVDRLNDHPAGRAWAAAPCLGLSAATCGVIDKIKDAATTGHLILPSVVGLALVGAGSPGLALELLLPCRKLSGVCRKLIVGGNEGVQLLLRPSVPILCHTLVDSDQLPVLGAGRSDNSIPSRQ